MEKKSVIVTFSIGEVEYFVITVLTSFKKAGMSFRVWLIFRLDDLDDLEEKSDDV